MANSRGRLRKSRRISLPRVSRQDRNSRAQALQSHRMGSTGHSWPKTRGASAGRKSASASGAASFGRRGDCLYVSLCCRVLSKSSATRHSSFSRSETVSGGKPEGGGACSRQGTFPDASLRTGAARARVLEAAGPRRSAPVSVPTLLSWTHLLIREGAGGSPFPPAARAFGQLCRSRGFSGD